MPSENTEQRKLAAIMFTDMVGYSALSQRNEALALELLAESQRLQRTQFPLFNGREVKTTGDGFLVEFPSALRATQCAVEIQRAVIARNSTQPGERHIQVRIGIHVGDVVHREADMYGDGVNIAARIEPLAIGGGICLSDTVYDQVRNKLEVGLTKLDSPDLKHIEVPMDVYRVVLPWEKQPDSSRRRESAHTHGGKGAVGSGTTDQRRLTSAATKSAAIAALVLLAVGLGWWLVHQSRQATNQVANPQTTAPAVASATDQKSIAVLPFVNMGADKADEYLSDGISEEIISALSKIKGLKVPARTSCFAFKGKNEDIQRIGQQLRVGTVLEGSISKVGIKLRVTAQLISIADGFLLWSETYDRTLDDLLAIRTDVAAHVAEALKGQLLGEEKQQLAKRTTQNPEAHRLYLQGRQLWNRRTAESLKLAVEYFNQAIAKDPGYAMAYAGLADCYLTLPEYAGLPHLEVLPKARAAALKALELDGGLAEARTALAAVKARLDWDWLGAETEFRRAIALNPNYATAHQWLMATVLRPLCRFEESLAEIKRAQELDPLSPVINVDLGECHSLLGRHDLGIQVLQRVITIDPSFLVAHRILGRNYSRAGKFPEAVAALEEMHRLVGNGAFGLEDLGMAYARAGGTAEARKILGRMLELQQQGNDRRVGIALVQHALGEDEQAFDSLDLAFAEHAHALDSIRYMPLTENLCSQPRVQAILKRMNLVK